MVKKNNCQFLAENMIIKSIILIDLCQHSENLESILDFVRGLFTFRLKGTRGLLYTVKFDFFDIAAERFKW